MSRFSTELQLRVYDDDHGYYYTVKQDGDALGMVEMSYTESDGKEKSLITMEPDAARQVAAAILRIIDHIEKNPVL